MIESEAKRFLQSFFKGDRFTDKSKQYINFSTKVGRLTEAEFDKLIAKEYVRLRIKKTVDSFYEINPTFQESVRRLITNSYVDSRMKSFFTYLKG